MPCEKDQQNCVNVLYITITMADTIYEWLQLKKVAMCQSIGTNYWSITGGLLDYSPIETHEYSNTCIQMS